MTNCFGIDASHYNSLSQSGLNSARAAGTTWFTHKASEGTSMRDDQFPHAVTWAKNAGMYVGAYHVIRSSPSVDAQGNFFLNAISRGYDWASDPGFIFQVDLEKWPYDSVSATQGTNFAQWLLDNTHRSAVFLYASHGQYGNSLHSPVKLWNANYPTYHGSSCPSEDFHTSYARSGGDNGPGWTAYSAQTPVFWQYSDNAVFGALYGLDANAFKGTEQDFAKLIGAAPSGTSAVKGDEDMAVIARGDDGTLYFCCAYRSYVINLTDFNNIVYLSKQGVYSLASGTTGPEWESAYVRLGWNEGAFGPVAVNQPHPKPDGDAPPPTS